MIVAVIFMHEKSRFVMTRWILHVALIASLGGTVSAQQPARPKIPKPGIEVPAEKQTILKEGLSKLQQAIDEIAKSKDAKAKTLLCDVEVIRRAVSDQLEFNEFHSKKDIEAAESLLEEGHKRAASLAEGKAPWTTATGQVIRGYVSRIDGSVQPYGLTIPESYTNKASGRYRLDVWFHGRGETLTEVNFLQGQRSKPGQFAPADTIVLHPYGRWCNAFKFAGETDVFEAIDAVRANYRVDDNCTSVRGFSMGGAATWHFAVHHADRWFAANPGAGFVESAKYLKIFESGEPEPPSYEQKLWGLYDCPPYARNLYHCPVIAYSGEKDKQKAAADMMAEILAENDISLAHIIGPDTEHKYHPAAAIEVERRLRALARYGRDQAPLSLQFDTQTLKYNRMHWVTIEGLEHHWETASVDADCTEEGILIDTKNVTDLLISFDSGDAPDVTFPIDIEIDGQLLESGHPLSDRSYSERMHRVEDKWMLGARPKNGLRKRHDLQGPIDDAFMDSFVFVEPTSKAANDAVDAWSRKELDFAVDCWRRYFRGRARVMKDTEIGDEEIAGMNLVLWGDPSSNAVIKKIADKLPIRWTKDDITAGSKTFKADSHAVVMIYPNPLNPNRYVVLNSGFTFPHSANGSNAAHTPKLPDWAIIDVREPRTGDAPGKVVAADFFGEQWQLAPPRAPAKRNRVALAR
jgi:pimeloyl-ACP methyl ester carboxylesterase